MLVAEFNQFVRNFVESLAIVDGHLQFNFLLEDQENLRRRFRNVFGGAFGAEANRFSECAQVLHIIDSPPVPVTSGVLNTCNNYILGKDGVAAHLQATYGTAGNDPFHNLSAAAKTWEKTLRAIVRKASALNDVKTHYNVFTDLMNEGQNLATDSIIRQDTQGVDQEARDTLCLKISEQKDVFWRFLTTYMDIDTIEENEYVSVLIPGMLPKETKDFERILGVLQKNDLKRIFMTRPLSCLRPTQMNGLSVIINQANELLKELSSIKPSRKETLNQKCKLVEGQIMELLTLTRNVGQNKVTLNHHIQSLEKMKTEIGRREIENPGLEISERLKVLIQGRIETLLISLNDTEEKNRLMANQDKVKIAAASKLITPVALPSLTDALVFNENWLPIFTDLKKSGTSDVNLKNLMVQSLHKESDKSIAAHPGCTAGELYHHLLKTYHSITAILPELEKRLNSLEQPKKLSQQLTNITSFQRIYAHLQKIKKENIIDEAMIKKLVPVLFTGHELINWIKEIQSVPSFKSVQLDDISSATALLDIDPETFLNEQGSRAGAKEQREFLCSYIKKVKTQTESCIAYKQSLPSTPKKEKEKEKSDATSKKKQIDNYAVGTSMGISSCVLCGMEHKAKNGNPSTSLYLCPKFKSLKLGQRKETLDKYSFCRICLRHKGQDHRCFPKDLTCIRILASNGQKCNSIHHHTWLHDSKKDGAYLDQKLTQTQATVQQAPVKQNAANSIQPGYPVPPPTIQNAPTLTSRMIVIQDAVGECDVKFIDGDDDTEDIFDTSVVLQSVVRGETINQTNGKKFKTLTHLDIGSTRSFITEDHAKRVGAVWLGEGNYTLSTLNSVAKTTKYNRYKVMFTIYDGYKEKVYPVECIGVKKIGHKSGISQSEHQQLCKAYGIPPEGVDSCSGEVNCLLGLDVMEHQPKHVTSINGRPLKSPPRFPNIALMKSMITPKLFFTGCYAHTLSSNNEVTINNITVDYIPQAETQKHVCLEYDAKYQDVVPIGIKAPPLGVTAPPMIGSGMFTGNPLKEILKPRPRSLLLQSYKVDFTKLTSKPNKQAVQSTELEIFKKFEDQLKCDKILSASSPLCLAHTLISCPDCLRSRKQLSFEESMEDQLLYDNLSLVPVTPGKFLIKTDHLFKDPIITSHSQENSNKLTAERSFKFCWKNALSLDSLGEKEGKPAKQITDGWIKAVKKEIDTGVLIPVPPEQLNKSPVCFAGLNIALQPEKPDHPVRIVTNGSLRHPMGSWNDITVAGSCSTNSLISVFLNWLMLPYAFQSDIQKAYRSIKIQKTTMFYLRVLFWSLDQMDGKAPMDLNNLTEYSYTVNQYGNKPAGSILRQALQFLSTTTEKQELKKFLTTSIYVDDALKSMKTPEDIKLLIGDMQELLSKYSMSVKTIFTSPEINPNLESYKTKALGYEADYEHDTVSLDLKFYVSKKKRGAYMTEAITKADLQDVPITLRTFCRFQAQAYDPCGLMVPTLIACLRQVFSVLNLHVTQICSDAKKKWDVTIHDKDMIEYVKRYMWISLDIAERLTPVPRARFLTGDTLHSLVLYTDSSIEIAGALLYVVAKNVPSGKLHSSLTLSRSKSFPGSVPAGEAFSMRLGLHLLETFLEEGLGVPFNEEKKFNVIFLSDSQCSLFNLNTAKTIEDMSLRNSATSVHAGLHRLCHSHPGMTSYFQWIESEVNLSDKLTRVSEENAYFTLDPMLRDGNSSLICDPEFPRKEDCCIIKTKDDFHFRSDILINQVRKSKDKNAPTLEPQEVTSMMINGEIHCDICQDAPTACGFKMKETTEESLLTNNPETSYLTHVHHQAEMTSQPETKDLLEGNNRITHSFFCTTESCTILDPHSHQEEGFSHRTLELDHYKRLVEKSHSLKNVCDYLSTLLKGIHQWRKKALPSTPTISPEWFDLEAFYIIMRTSQEQFPVSSRMTGDLVTFQQYGILFVIQRFHSYSLGPKDCRKRNLPLISPNDPLARLILNDCHLVENKISFIISSFHLNGKQTFASSKKGALGTFILRGHGLAREVVRSCPRCRKQSTRTFPSPLHSHWWTRLMDTTNGSKYLFNVTAWDIIGPVDVTEKTTALRSRRSTPVWFAVGVCVLTRYMVIGPMRDFSAESFLDAVSTLMKKYGVSDLVISDKGTSTFTNRHLVKQYLPNTKVIQAERECLYLNGLCESRIKMLKSLCRTFLDTIRHQRNPVLNLITLINIMESAISLINTAPLPGIRSDDYFPISPADLATPLRSTANTREQTTHVENDSTTPDLQKDHSCLQQLHHAVIKVWEDSLTEGHKAMSRKTDIPIFLSGDVVFLKYPSKEKQGYWKFGIILKQISKDSYLIRYLARRSKDREVVTHGTILLDQRMFTLLYRPDEEKDQNFIESWNKFSRKFQDIPVTKERNRTNDNKQLDQMFKLEHAVPHPPANIVEKEDSNSHPLTPAANPDIVPADDSDPLEELLQSFPQPSPDDELQDAVTSLACTISLYRLRSMCETPIQPKFFKKMEKKIKKRVK